ncbi:hypothetical protein C9374_006427 [Naegleria lovaniensis]|uniref:Fe2OG dioxygenase domain-containing protein n=1 Tax=Naegleria lovaniensis TaxID=51637 RepID=A0AA88KJ53_NAELO|nr:uncharacterized protein C9374_006427 [Naegleria lovaniensis]KAG2381438.1 hypothetical protein C9374_006427 [Naegleria lovaniensis]
MTSIDFAALYQEERKKALAQIKTSNKNKSSSACSSSVFSRDDQRSIFRERVEKIDLSKYKLEATGIDSIYYIGEFISKEEEKALVDAIYQDDDKKELNYGEKKSWVSLSKRRLKNLGGVPHPSGMYLENLPKYICDFNKVLYQSGLDVEQFVQEEEQMESSLLVQDKTAQLSQQASYNQVLLNEYQCGKGIRPHKDGPLYSDVALVLSLQTTCLIDFYAEKPKAEYDEIPANIACNVFLQPRSLLIFCGKAYTDYFHGVRDVDRDEIDSTKCMNMNQANVEHAQVIPRGTTRLSLTIRKVRRVVSEKVFTSHEAEEIERRRKWWEQAIDN